MNTSITPIPVYKPHEGTVKISGSTVPRGAGRCAFYYLQRGLPVEFFCIGANANQQAMKAMGIFMNMVNENEEFKKRRLSVAFQPLRFMTDTIDIRTQDHRDKDATVWKTFLVQVAV